MNGRPRILIVDDNPGMLETLADIVVAAGFDVDTAPDGPAALKMLRSVGYAVAIVDIVLPGMSGIDLVKRCHEESLISKFVMISAYTGSELCGEAKVQGVAGVLSKPLDPGQLVGLLRRLTQ